MWRHVLIAVVLLAPHVRAAAHDVVVPAVIGKLPAEHLTPRIYVIHGPQALPSPRTHAFMNNPGFIVTAKGVVVIDPGSSLQVGHGVLDKIAEITDKPVVAVLNTHVHGDHWLGNQAVHVRFPAAVIYAHQRMIERARKGEGDYWIGLFQKMTGGALKDTVAVLPTVGLKGGEELDFGDTRLRILHTGKAHTDHDLMIEVLQDKSMFTGDVVTSHRVPSSDVPQDADFKGQIKAIETILAGDDKIFIPGHGRSGGREVPKASLRFLKILYASVRKYYEQGLADYEMKDKVAADLAEFKDWHNFDQLGRVISYVYQQVEQESFN
jgi:glyoxylase-like metal-dependent hydrolase (beta-lactamase superfamily II)